jgi:arylsulfatase A-like enzyme
LKENGYSTSAYGKWHNTPMWEVSPAGPFDHWPTGLGFEHFYGFNQAADSQYYPRIFNDTTPVEPSKTPQEGYHFTTDITDKPSTGCISTTPWPRTSPSSSTSPPAPRMTPHHVDKKWIEKYRGQVRSRGGMQSAKKPLSGRRLGVIPANAEFTPRPDRLPAWDSLTAQQKKLLAHEAEVYAGYCRADRSRGWPTARCDPRRGQGRQHRRAVDLWR